MAPVPIPRDLGAVEPRVLGFLTKRQLLALGLGLALGIPLYILFHRVFSQTASTLLLMVCLLPCFLLTFGRLRGVPCENYLKRLVRFLTRSRGDRPYQTKRKGGPFSVLTPSDSGNSAGDPAAGTILSERDRPLP